MQSAIDLQRAINHQLDQCEQNTVEIGDKVGHFISQRQVDLIRQLLEQHVEATEGGISIKGKGRAVSRSPSPQLSTQEQQLRAERRQVAKELRFKEIQLESASKVRRPALNEEIGALLSRRARIDKKLNQFS